MNKDDRSELLVVIGCNRGAAHGGGAFHWLCPGLSMKACFLGLFADCSTFQAVCLVAR